MKQVLIHYQFENNEAGLWAEYIIMAIEGEIMLGRTFHSREPLENAGKKISLAISECINQKKEVKK